MLKRYLAILALLAVLFASSACSVVGNQPLRIAITADPETLDPRALSGRYDAMVAKQLFECLTVLDESGVARPAAAESWDEHNGERVFVFHLQKNAKWSDGSAVTAADFEYSWLTHLDPHTASPTSDLLYYIKNAERYNNGQCSAKEVGIKAIDDYTLQVELERSTPFFPEMISGMAFAPVCKKAIQAGSADFINPDKIICNGAYVMKGWIRNSKIAMDANSHYRDSRNVLIDKAEFIISDNASTQLVLLESDKLDVLFDPPLSEVEQLKAKGLLRTYPLLGTSFYSFNTQRPPFDDARVREAFCLAIDRKAICKSILQGMFQPAYALVAPGMHDERNSQDFRAAGGDYFVDDAAKARKLLAAAGYTAGKGFPAIELLYDTNSANKQIAEACQQMWKKELGVNVTLRNMEWKVFLAERRKYNYYIVRDGWTADYSDPYTYLALFSDKAGATKANYRDAIYDSLLNTTFNAIDTHMRYSMLHQSEAYLINSFAIAPLYYSANVICASSRMQDIAHNSLGDIYVKDMRFK